MIIFLVTRNFKCSSDRNKVAALNLNKYYLEKFLLLSQRIGIQGLNCDNSDLPLATYRWGTGSQEWVKQNTNISTDNINVFWVETSGKNSFIAAVREAKVQTKLRRNFHLTND